MPFFQFAVINLVELTVCMRDRKLRTKTDGGHHWSPPPGQLILRDAYRKSPVHLKKCFPLFSFARRGQVLVRTACHTVVDRSAQTSVRHTHPFSIRFLTADKSLVFGPILLPDRGSAKPVWSRDLQNRILFSILLPIGADHTPGRHGMTRSVGSLNL